MPHRSALVTGPTSGIGLAFARRLASSGHDLVLVSRTRERLEQVAAELRGTYAVQAEVIVADLGDREQLARVEERVTDESRPLDLVVNNAGFALKHGFLDNSAAEEQHLLDTHVTAVLRITHAALGAMVDRGSGAIVNVASVAALLPRGTYSAAKAYVLSLSEWADLTYRKRGVQVMALLPGFTRTEMHARMEVGRGSAPRWMWLDADRLVEEALQDLERGRRISIPSRRYKALAAAARWTPSTLQARLQGLGRR